MSRKRQRSKTKKNKNRTSIKKLKFGKTSKKMNDKYRRTSLRKRITIAAGLAGTFYVAKKLIENKMESIENEKYEVERKGRREVKKMNEENNITKNMLKLEEFNKTEAKKLVVDTQSYTKKLDSLKTNFYDLYVEPFFKENKNPVTFSDDPDLAQKYSIISSGKIGEFDPIVYNRLLGNYLINMLLSDYNIKSARTNMIYFIPYKSGKKFIDNTIDKAILDFGKDEKNRDIINKAFIKAYTNYTNGKYYYDDDIKFLCLVKYENIDIKSPANIVGELTDDQFKAIHLVKQLINDITHVDNTALNGKDLVFYDTKLYPKVYPKVSEDT